MQNALCFLGMLYAKCEMRYASWACFMLNAKCFMLYAFCEMRYALIVDNDAFLVDWRQVTGLAFTCVNVLTVCAVHGAS